MNKLNNANFVHYFNMLESGSHIYGEFMYGENKYYLLIDKETGHLVSATGDEGREIPI